VRRPCPINVSLHYPPLDNFRVMVIVWRLKGNIIRTAPCWVVWHNVHSQQHTHMSSSYGSSRLGLSHWDPYAMHRGGYLELYYCNMVEWSWWDSGLICKTNWFLQCFNTVGLVIWPVKIVPDMTCNVFGGTLHNITYITYSFITVKTERSTLNLAQTIYSVAKFGSDISKHNITVSKSHR